MLFSFRRRRVYRVVLLIGLICIVLLCFQFFLLGSLNHSIDDRSLNIAPKDLSALENEAVVDVELNFEGSHIKRDVLAECMNNSCNFEDALLINRVKNTQHLDRHFMRNKTAGFFKPVADIPFHIAGIHDDTNSVLKFDAAGHSDETANPQKYVDVWLFLEHVLHQGDITIFKPVVNASVVRNTTLGVNSKWQHLYVPDEHDMFTCFLSQEMILFSQVNDDYCDCSDSSDEPGTSACPNSRFYCAYQMTTAHADNPKWLPSGRVNDGICDCCDGSDEWNNVKLPSHIVAKDGAAHYGVYQSPCVDRCQELRQEEAKFQALRLRGQAIKEEYRKAGLAANNNSDELYGHDAVFYKLRQLCLELNVNKYVYTICPFRSAKQAGRGHESIVIGHQARWLDKGPDVYRLILEGGDSRNCPESQPRQTMIEFECGIEDRVVSVSESEVCRYLVHFSTPAAC